MMKACDVIQFYSPLSGGIKNYVHSKARWFAENQPDVEHFVIVPGDKNEQFKIANSIFYAIKSPKLPFSTSYRVLCSKKQIEKVLLEESPDIIETCDPYITAKICNKLAVKHNIPTVAFYHSDFPRTIPPQIRKVIGGWLSACVSMWALKYLKKLYKNNKALIVASSTMTQSLKDDGFENVVNISLGINTDLYLPIKNPESIRDKYGVSKDKQMILFVGRFCFEKNLLNLIDAFKILSKTRRDMQLVLVGDGELKNKMCKLTETFDDILILPYFRDREELVQMYSTADMFVHPGVLETFGFVTIEAQSCGTKVVFVKNSIVHESCKHDEDNVAAESEFPDAIAEAIDKSLEIHTSWEQRLFRHQQMVEHFSNDSTYSQMTKLYHDVID